MKLDTFMFTNPQVEVKRVLRTTPLEDKILSNFALKKKRPAKLINYYMEDILSHSKLFEWGGVSFSDEVWYKLRMAMKKLMVEKDCKFIRFFGKIFGINSDYYIVQGIQNKFPMQNPQPHIESKGNEGINRYTFWVSNSILEKWEELPEITKEQIVTSRKFKYIFTGDLNSPVNSFVLFEGREKHLLKCQIVRILHSSCICPKGLYKTDENFKEALEGKVTEFDEEYKSPSFEEMKSPEAENWVHEQAYIFPNGKVIDPENENQVERLKGINEDEGYKIKEGEGENAEEKDMKYWRVKVVGDQIMHNKPNGDPITHAVVLVRNLRWPGTLVVWKEEKFANIYVGFGVKATDANYFPTEIPKVDKDTREPLDQKEPNPEKEPPKPEEEKEGEEGEEKKEGEEEQGEEE